MRCSKDCKDVTHTVAEFTAVLYSCGWNAESSTCQQGYVTSKSERAALLEADLGACGHHTLSPTLTPTPRPSAAPAVNPTKVPTGFEDVNYPTVMLFTSGDIDRLTSRQREDLETAVRQAIVISYDVPDESIVEVQFKSNYRRSRSLVFTIAVLLELGPTSFNRVRKISELVNGGKSLVVELFGQRFRSFASSFLLTNRLASTTLASMETLPTTISTTQSPPTDIDETETDVGKSIADAEDAPNTSLGLIVGIFLTLMLLIGLIIMNTLRKDRLLKGISKSVPQSVIDELRTKNRQDIEAAVSNLSPRPAVSQKAKAPLSPKAMHRLRHVQVSDAEYAVQWLDHIDGDEMDDIWEQCDEGALVGSAGPMPYSASFGSSNPDTFQKGNVFDRAHFGRVRHTNESTVSGVSEESGASTIPTYDALRSQFTAALEMNSADGRDKSAEVPMSRTPPPGQRSSEAIYALTSGKDAALRASDFEEYDQVGGLDVIKDSRQGGRHADPSNVGYEGIDDAPYDSFKLVGDIDSVGTSSELYDRAMPRSMAGTDVYDLADEPVSAAGDYVADYGRRYPVASPKLRVYNERLGAPLSPNGGPLLPLSPNYDLCGAETARSASTLTSNDTGRSDCSCEPPIVANYGGYAPPVLSPNGRPPRPSITSSFKNRCPPSDTQRFLTQTSPN